ncbi:MAG: cellulase family glycosylhydrolase [Methanotrichaceae archaeon]|nr:cellulase family glycosylhydrolase [Methanotrichaceae archaeon]
MRISAESKLLDSELILEPDGFHDSEGRLIHFRGVNVAGNAKLPPFIPFENEGWWDLLAQWGFNMVRLTLFWEAIEPEPDLYCRSYIDMIREIVHQASKRGIYVLLDMYQDLYSRWLKGDGAPDWSFPKKVDPKNNDSFGGRFWGLAYTLSQDVRDCFSNFFESKYLKDHYRNSWLEIAEIAKDNLYILGYDIMNEPFGGNISNYDGRFENNVLKPFIEDIITSIRDVHQGAVGFVEPNISDMYTSKLTPFKIDNLVYAPHLYNPLSSGLRFDPLPQGLLFNLILHIHLMKAKYLQMPLFIGEFGAPWTMQPSYARNMAINDALEVLENSFVPNAYWDFSTRNVDAWNEEDYSLIDQTGNTRGLDVNVRPYIRSLRGDPVYQRFDAMRKVYATCFKSEPGVPPTIIHIPESIQYPDGFSILVSDGSMEYHYDNYELYYFPSYNCHHYITIKPFSN